MTPKLSLRRRMAGRLGLAAMLLAPCRAGAAAVWSAATEYPATAMPGEGLATLARLLAEGSAGAIILQPAYDAPDGLRSATIPTAVQAGRVVVGDSFGGATIDRPSAALAGLLRRAAQDEVAAWVHAAGPDLAALIGQ